MRFDFPKFQRLNESKEEWLEVFNLVDPKIKLEAKYMFLLK